MCEQEPKFWLVWNERCGPPTFKHYTLDAAKREAERLALNNPGERFHVLESLGTVRTHRPVEWTEHDDRLQVPF